MTDIESEDDLVQLGTRDDVRSRGWVFTINNYTEDDENNCFDLHLSCVYMVVGKERGERRDTPHLQGFVYFQSARTFSAVRDKLPRAHISVMRGTVDQAADYCMKEGDYYEHGVRPMSQKRKGECGAEAIAERWRLAKSGSFEELPPEQIKVYEYIYRRSLVVVDRPDLDNVWVFGQSGCGKSRWVRDTHPVFYSKPMSKWWDGYNGEDVVVLDDFDPSHGKFLGYFLKIWADHYAFNAEVKGGMLKIRPKTVIVTSQYRIEDCFESKEDVDAIVRRFKLLNM